MTKIVSFSILALLLTLTFVTANAQASVVYEYAEDVIWTGINVAGSERSDITNALGEADGQFLSLAGGSAAFTFDTQFNTVSVVEITYGNRENWTEYADVYVGTGTATTAVKDLTYWGSISNSSTSSTIDLSSLTGTFDFLVLVDATKKYEGHAGDGFDVDAVGVAATPIPAAAWLLGSGLVGLVGFRRKFKSV